MKRQLFKLIDEEHHLRPPPHILIDGTVLVFAASFLCAAPIILAVALAPASLIAGNTATALFLLAPMILGQSLLDLLLAATRWTHKMRHQVWARSIIEPYAGVAASWLAWAAGYRGTGPHNRLLGRHDSRRRLLVSRHAALSRTLLARNVPPRVRPLHSRSSVRPHCQP